MAFMQAQSLYVVGFSHETIEPTPFHKTWKALLQFQASPNLQFSELHNRELVKDFVCFYTAPDERLDYVIQVGK